MSKYIEIYNTMFKLITSGSWPIGGKIPSENQLKSHYKVNRLTIRKSLDILKEESLIKKEKGSRSIVTSRKAKHTVSVSTTLDNPDLKKKRTSILTKYERKIININKFTNEDIFEIERLFYDNNKPVFIARGQVFSKSILGLNETFFKLQKYNNASLSEILINKYSLKVFKQEIKSEAIILSKEESNFFKVSKNYPATKWISNFYNYNGNLLFTDIEISLKEVFLELSNRNLNINMYNK